MEELEELLAKIDPGEDEFYNLINISEKESDKMSHDEFSAALNERIFKILSPYGWENVKQVAKSKFPETYIFLLNLSDREEDIDDIKEIILHPENFEVDKFDIRDFVEKISDLEFLAEVATNSSTDVFIRNEAISRIVNTDLDKAKDTLKNVQDVCAVSIQPATFEKIDDEEFFRLLLDNSKKFTLGTDNENILLSKLYKKNPEDTKEYIKEILEKPTKHCVVKYKIGSYFLNLLSNIQKVDKEYSYALATQMIDKFKEYGIKNEKISEFADYVHDTEKIREYLGNYKEMGLDAYAIQELLKKLSEVDKSEAVSYAKKIISTIDKENVGLKMTCIVSTQDSDFMKECIENSEKYNLNLDQQCTLIARTQDPDYIINKISTIKVKENSLYSILLAANNENVYLHCIRNADALDLNVYRMYKMMADSLPVACVIKQLKGAERNKMGNTFKEVLLEKIVSLKNPDFDSFILKYIKNYKSHQLHENSLIDILSEYTNQEFIDAYLDAKDTPVKEKELKLFLYSADANRRKQVLELVLSGKVPLTEETKKAAVFAAYTIKDAKKRKDILKSLKVENSELKSKVDIPDDMTVGIEIESIGSFSKEIQNLKTLIFTEWEAKKDGSLGNDEGIPGVEVTSPILRGDDPEINNKIAYVSNFLTNEGQTTNNSCGGHIHIGADYFKDYESYQNLVDLWINCEKVLYIISNQVGEVPRENISDYAKPISKPFEKVVEGGFVDFANIESLRDIEGQLNFVSKRCYGINFSNLSNYVDKHTIEFRIPNGTVNPNTWIENINLFGNLLKKCQTITEIRKKDKDQLTHEDKTQLKVYNALVFGDLTMDDRAELLIDFVLPESQQKTFHDRYFVNSKLLNMQEGIKSFLSNETFAKPIDVADLKQKLFEKEGRVTGLEYAVCTSILAHELQSMKGMNHEY